MGLPRAIPGAAGNAEMSGERDAGDAGSRSDLPDWRQMQRQWLEEWGGIWQRLLSATPSTGFPGGPPEGFPGNLWGNFPGNSFGNPWGNLLGNPWGNWGAAPFASPGVPGGTSPWGGGDWAWRLLSQYLMRLSEEARAASGDKEGGSEQGPGTGDREENWKEMLDRCFTGLQKEFERHWRDAAEGRGIPWFAGTMGMAPPAWLTGFARPVRERWDSLADMPGVGYFRERQEAFQKLLRLLRAFADKAQAHNAFLEQVPLYALEELRDRLSRCASEKQTIDSVRELYDLWMDCCGAVYERRASSEEYSRLYGELVNAAMALRKHWQELADGQLSLLGLPERRVQDTLIRRQQELRREFHAMREAQKDLGAALAALRKELKARRPAQARRAAAGARRKKRGGRTAAADSPE